MEAYNRLKPVFTAVVVFLAMFFATSDADAALTAQQVAQKAATVISNSSGIDASFVMKVDGMASKGTIKSAGKKFTVILPQVSSWYNGTALYTYNPNTSETTVIEPTAQELLESNPLLYVKGGASGYSYSFSSAKKSGKYIVDLVPRNKRSGLKKLTFTIDSRTFYPERIVVNAGSSTIVVEVTSLKAGVKIASSAFEYPKSRYPKAEIVDLR